MFLDNIIVISIAFFSYGLWLLLNMISGYRDYRRKLIKIGRGISRPTQPMHLKINRDKQKLRDEAKLMLKANTICSFIPALNIMVYCGRIVENKNKNKVKK
jgi:hypothetical protein